jgi:hypothetical protein
MKKIKGGILLLVTALFISVSSCGPNDDSGGMDQKNSDGEGKIDSTRIPNFDTTSAFHTVPGFIRQRAELDLAGTKVLAVFKHSDFVSVTKNWFNLPS